MNTNVVQPRHGENQRRAGSMATATEASAEPLEYIGMSRHAETETAAAITAYHENLAETVPLLGLMQYNHG